MKIRSTQKLATSDNYGLCDVQRTLVSFDYNLEERKYTIQVIDKFFQEQTVKESQLGAIIEEGEVDREITERKIIEVYPLKKYSYHENEIDAFYANLGISITKTKKFTAGLVANLLLVLLAQTASAQIQTMTDWVEDTEHVIVKEFTQINQ